MALAATDGVRTQGAPGKPGAGKAAFRFLRRDDETSPATNLIEDRETSSP